MTTTGTTETETMKINDRVKGVYFGQQYTGILKGFSGSKFGTFVSIELDAPITVCGTERDSIGFHLDGGNETIEVVENREPVEVGYFQGYFYART